MGREVGREAGGVKIPARSSLLHLGVQMRLDRLGVLLVDRGEVFAAWHQARIPRLVGKIRERRRIAIGVGHAPGRDLVLVCEACMVMLLRVQLEKELGEALGPDASVEERAHHVDDQLVHPQVLGQQRGEVPRAAAIPAARWAHLSGGRNWRKH